MPAGDHGNYGNRGLAYYTLGNFAAARASCESKPDYWLSEVCLAVIYDKLARHGDAEAVVAKLDERGRLLFAAAEVRTAGRGGLALVELANLHKTEKI